MSRSERSKKHTTRRQMPDHTLQGPLEAYPGSNPPHANVHTRPTTDTQITPSKSQRKRQAHAMQVLGEQLVTLPRAHLARLALPDALYQAILAVRGMRAHGARARQMQLIGKLMRQLDPAMLRTVCEAVDPHHSVMQPPPL